MICRGEKPPIFAVLESFVKSPAPLRFLWGFTNSPWTGERRAGNPHTAFDVAGIGNVAWSRCCDTRRRKGETTGNTNIDLNRRASPRPYLGARNSSGDSDIHVVLVASVNRPHVRFASESDRIAAQQRNDTQCQDRTKAPQQNDMWSCTVIRSPRRLTPGECSARASQAPRRFYG